jgi:hypothetical protein
MVEVRARRAAELQGTTRLSPVVMPIVKRIKVEIDPAEVLRRQEGSRARPVRPALRDLTRELLAMTADQELIEPAIAYESFPVAEVRGSRIVLEGGALLEGRRLVSLLGEAERVVGVMCTIGPRLDDKVSALHADDDALASVLLDGIGNAALDAVAVEACHLVRREAEREGLHASGSLSPGLFGLPLDNQTVLQQLIGGERIGIAHIPVDDGAP